MCGCIWAGRATNSSYRPASLPEPVDRAGMMLGPAGCCQLTPLEGGQDANPCSHSRADYHSLCVPVQAISAPGGHGHGHGRNALSSICRPGRSTEAATAATAKDNQAACGFSAAVAGAVLTSPTLVIFSFSFWRVDSNIFMFIILTVVL